jgi:hypothetical protein
MMSAAGKNRSPRALAFLLVLAASCFTVSAKTELYVYETEFLKLVYYNKNHEYLVPHLARCFENSLAFHRELFDYTPSEQIVILLHDFGDHGHGGTSTVPWNYISIGIEPFDYVYDTMPANERMNWLMHHELVHVVATDKAARADVKARKLFLGKVAPTDEQPLSMLYSYLTSPRWYSPRWYHEGIAVFLETWMAGGLGRVLGGYDEMVFRTMVLEDHHFYDIVGLESEGTTIDFQVGQNSYLYGTRFVSFLAEQHGPEKVIQWFDRNDDSERYFAAQFRKIFGVQLRAEWARWIEWEHEWQRANLARIRHYPVTKDRPLVDVARGSASRAHYDAKQNRVLVAVNYPGETAHIEAIGLDDGRVERIADVVSPALYYVSFLAYDPQDRKLFYTSDNTRGWRDLNEVDLATGKHRILLKDCRVGDLVVHPVDRSLWAVQHHDGLSSIVRIPPPYDKWENLVTLDYGRDLFDLDISPDGQLLSATLIEINGRQRLVTMQTEKLRGSDSSFEVLHEFPDNSPANFVFSSDGRYLYGNSYYTGISNIFRYDLRTGAVEAVTNAETGYFRPLPLSGDTLFAFRYTGAGLLPVTLPPVTTEDVNAIDYLGQQVVERHPQVKQWKVGSPLNVDLDRIKVYSGEYRAAKRLKLASIYPVLEGYRDTFALGARFNIADPMRMHSMDVTLAGSPRDEVGTDGEVLHLNVRYDHWPWRIRGGYNSSNFYDLFGPTRSSRKGTWLQAGYENYIIYDRPRTFTYDVALSGYLGIDELPEYQDIGVDVDRYASLSGGLSYQSFRRTIGAVESERGVGWRFGSVNNHVDGDLLSRVHTNLVVGIPTALEHSSIWLHGSTGYSFGDENLTFSNFYFGGFGNNWIDHGRVRRYREYYSFPGMEISEIEANNYAKLMLEWVLPPARFRRAGWSSFYTNWMQFSLFASGLVANPYGSLERRELANVGVQVDLKLVLFSNLPSTLSLGYATAFESQMERRGEFMISLALLR